MLLTRPRTRLFGVMLMTVAIAGCGSGGAADGDEPSEGSASSGSGTASPVAGTPDGWERHESTEGGFAISLPRGWEAADLTSGDIEQLAETLRQQPETAAIADQLPAMMEQGVAFWAFNADPESIAQGFATNLNVVVQPDTGMSQETYVAGNISFVEETFDVDVTRADVDLPIGQAVRADYEAEFAGAPPTHTTQYYIVVDDKGLIATFTRLKGEDFADLEEEFAQIIETWEALP
jgi:hypothetical protein